jgi:curved DNA-binding protein CbpA
MNSSILYDDQNDHYKILNVKEDAELNEIKKSFFALSMKLHPDKGGNENDFKKLNSAYEVLKNEENRKVYDRLRKEHFQELNDRINKSSKNTNNKKSNEKDSYYHNRNFYDYANKKRYNYTQSKSDYKNNSYSRDNNQEDYKNYYGYYYKNNKDSSKDDYDIYKEFFEYLRKHQNFYNDMNYQNRGKSQFEKFKINVKYEPIKEIIYDDFIITNSHKLYKNNRLKYYQRLKLMNYIKLGYNPFSITNNMNQDKDYLNLLKASNTTDDEGFNKKISIRDLFRVYKKKKIIVIFFSLLNIFTLIYLIF